MGYKESISLLGEKRVSGGNLRGFLVLFLLATSCAAVFASDANSANNVYDMNLLSWSGAAAAMQVSSSNGTYKGNFILNEAPTGSWSSTTGNYLLRVGEFFDQNVPKLTLIGPPVSQSTTTVVVQYSVSSIGNPLKRFWLQFDSGGWIDNGLNTSYTTTLANGVHTINVVATDAYDLNSATASTTVTVNTITNGGSPTTTTTPSTTSAPGTGGVVGGSPPSPPAAPVPAGPVAPTVAQLPLTAAVVDNPANVVSRKDYAPVVTTTGDGLRIAKSASFMTVTPTVGGATTPVYVFNVGVRNNTQKPLSNVRVRETIPKTVASNVSQVTFREQPSAIIQSDPVVEWSVASLAPGQETGFEYFVTKLADQATANSFDTFAKSLQAPAAQASVAAPPTIGSPAPPSSRPPQEKGVDWVAAAGGVAGLVIIGVVVIVVLLGAYWYFAGGKRR